MVCWRQRNHCRFGDTCFIIFDFGKLLWMFSIVSKWIHNRMALFRRQEHQLRIIRTFSGGTNSAMCWRDSRRTLKAQKCSAMLWRANLRILFELPINTKFNGRFSLGKVCYLKNSFWSLAIIFLEISISNWFYIYCLTFIFIS